MRRLLMLACALCSCFTALATAAPAPRQMSWTVDGVQREALVFAPTMGSAQDAHAVVFAFHGHGGNMHGFARSAGLQTRLPHAIVVYPQGLPTVSPLDPGGRKPGWQHEAGAEGDRDLKFVDAMLATLRTDFHVDDRHVFATGFSNGAMFSLLLWTQRSSVFAGFAIVAGALDPSLQLPSARPVLHVAGEKDPLVTLRRAEATIAEERRIDGAGAPGQSCGEGCTVYRGDRAMVKTLVHPGGHEYTPQAAEATAEFLRELDPPGRGAAAAAAAATDTPDPGAAGAPKADVIRYKSGGRELMAFVYKPDGDGPFPVYMWNHGSEHDPPPGALLAKFWVPHGFVLFAPLRSGHGPNPGKWIGDEQKRILDQRSPAGFERLMQLHTLANDDVVAAYRWIARQPFVDAKRIVVAGGSFGGIQALLSAERDANEHLGVKCVVAMAPAAESWGNPNWGKRLATAVDAARAPILLLQAQNDFSLGPSEVLGPRVDAKGGANRHKVLPAHGDPADHAQGHGGFFADPAAWSDDVLAFLHACGEL